MLNSLVEPIEVSVTNLKCYPEEYDGKRVRMTAYISSLSDSGEGVCVSEQMDISFDYQFDSNPHYEDSLAIKLDFGECDWMDKSIEVGDEVVVIGWFVYSAEDEFPYFPYGYLSCNLLYQP